MDPTAARDAPPADPRLDALDRAATPALLVAADGSVAWANAAGHALGAGDRLDSASARAAAGLGATGLLRLRLGVAGRFEPLAFQARRIVIGDVGFVLLEALAAPARRPWAPRPQTVAADGAVATEPADADAAAEIAPPDGMLHGVAADAVDDRPPDPREDIAVAADAVDQARPRAADEPPGPPRALRFVFEIDADGRLSFLSPDLAEAVGDSAALAVGRPWSDVAEALALDPSGAVADALAGRGGWSGLRIAWPTSDGGALPLALSALPVFDRGRTFVGFRGLGAEIADETPQVRQDDEQPAEAEDRHEADAEPTAARAEPPVLRSVSEPREAFAGNVVALHDASGPSPLSRVEESAFDEIARRLAEAGATAPATAVSDVSARDVWQDIAADAELSLGSDDAAEAEPGGPWRFGMETAGESGFRRLLDRMPIGALVLRGGAPVYANRKALEMSGHGDLAALAARGLDQLFGEPLKLDDAAPAQMRLTASDGVEIDVEVRVSAIEWADAPATAVLLKRQEGATAALIAAHEREKELAAILDTATDGVLTLDGAGRILSINRSAEALFGYEASEIVGSLFSLALAPESRRAAYEYLDGLKTSAVASVLNDGREVLGLVRQGGAIPLYMTLGRIGSAEDGRYCAVLRDITHWKKAEEELLAARRQAERASAQKSDFLAKVSHEIRTPLNAIIGFAEVMMEERFGAVGNERYKDYLRDIHLSGQHIVSLVNDLLDLSKIEAGKLELAFVDVDLNETVAQAVALLQPQANRDRIIIRTSLARALPQVRADVRSVRQIVLNLASNAVKFTQGGGQVIVATALNDLGEPVIRVRDTGVGMSRREVALALEPFKQSPLGGGDGAGLGLPLTKALAEANRASFAIESAVGEGTLVEITFPTLRAAE